MKNNTTVNISQAWDGADSSGKTAPNGKYTYTINAVVSGKSAAAVSGRLTVFGVPSPSVIISDLAAVPGFISPNGDGKNDTTNLSAAVHIAGFDTLAASGSSFSLAWTLTIKNSSGTKVRQYTGRQNVSNNTNIDISQSWDGKNFNNKVVADGSYTYIFSATALKINSNAPTAAVTVKALAQISVSVSPASWSIGNLAPGAISTMSDASKITVTNNGNTIENYSLKLVDPAGWQNSQTAVDSNTYILNAAFASSSSNISWNEASHALSTADALCSISKFAGDQTGFNVSAGAVRTLWFQFKAPSSTNIKNEQTIEVVVTAQLQ